MTRYPNGRAPLSAMVQIRNPDGSLNPSHWLPAATAAKHYELVKRAHAKYGKWLRITPGWNGYRPWDEQVIGRRNACAQGNCLAAAYPGFSSHGLTWFHKVHTRNVWVDAAAIDYGNWWEVFPGLNAWADAVEEVGLRFGLIRKDVAGVDEWWHVIDLDPWGPIPASNGAIPFPIPLPEPEEEDMTHNAGFKYTRKSDGKEIILLSNTQSKWWMEYVNTQSVVPAGNTPIAKMLGIEDAFVEVSEDWATAHKVSLGR